MGCGGVIYGCRGGGGGIYGWRGRGEGGGDAWYFTGGEEDEEGNLRVARKRGVIYGWRGRGGWRVIYGLRGRGGGDGG